MLPLDHMAAVRKVMGMATVRAVDFAGYTRIPTPQDVANLKAQNVQRVIIGTRGNRRNFVAQAAACQDFELHAYIYVYWNEPAVIQTMNALALIRQVPAIRTVWVDVESDVQNEVYGNPRDTVDTVLATLQPYRTGIYTSISQWADIMQDSHAYSRLPLWDAAYGSEGAAFHAYGGWLTRAMHQYAGSVDLAGLNVDMNTVEERMEWTDKKLDEALTNILGTLSKKADDQKVNDLANAIDSLPPTRNGLRFLWAAAAKMWPFGQPSDNP